MINAIFKPLDTEVYTNPAKQWDYGQILRIQGVTLPKAVEVHFGISGEENTVPSVGVTDGDHTDVEIPDGLLRQPNDLVAYVYIADVEKGNTVKTINIPVIARAKPAIPHTPEDEAVFREAIEAVNTAADRAEKAGQAATEAAGQAAEDAQQTAEDRKEVAKMVESVSGISEQVKKVEELSQKAQEAATKAGKSEQAADGFKTQAESAKKGAEAAAVKTAEDKTAVDNAKTEVLEAKTEVNADRTVVEQVKNEVEQLGGSIAGAVQSGVQEITQAGTAQKTAVEAAGTQAVENVENAQQAAAEAVGAAKTAAVQEVQAEGAKQTGNVTTEGTKQVKAVQDKGNEVLQSIPEDFQMQMESKLDKQQGVENKGKALVIGEDGNVAPGEVQSGGGDGIAIINTMSGESPLVIPDSAERVNKRLELGGKTEQNQDPPPSPEYLQEIKNSGKWNEEKQKYEVDVKITGKNLFDMNKFIDTCNFTKNEDGTFVIDKRVERYDCFIPANTILSIEVLKVQDSSGAAVLELFYEDGKSMHIGFGQVGVKTFLIQKDVAYIKVLAYRNHEYKYIQLEKGNTATPYESYKEQTLTLTSDRPITKWDRLVEQGGEIGWLYKSKTATITGKEHYSAPSESYYSGTSTNMYTVDFGLFIKGGEYCNRLQRIDCIWGSSNINNIGFTTNGSNQIHIRIYNSLLNVSDNATKEEKVAAFKTYLMKEYENGNPYIVIFQTKDTEFIPLPQSEQNAIRALKTYYPTTVITADGGEVDPDIKVTYTADTKNYIDNKVSAKVASIIRQYRLNTANLLSLMPMETQAAMIENDTNNILNNLESEETHE